MHFSASAKKTPGDGGFLFGRHELLWAAASVLVVAWLYSSVWGFGYVWDDRAFFLTSTNLREGGIWAAITEPVLAGSAYFRPLVMAWFVAEIRLLGADPAYPHAANLALHLGNMALVGLLARRVSGFQATAAVRAPTPALDWRPVVAILLYGLHPALIEPVAWISGRFDLLVGFFSLLTLLLVTSTNRAIAMLAGLAFFAAALSKEMAVTVPAVAVLFDWALRFSRQSLPVAGKGLLGGRRVWIWLALLAGGLGYLAIRMLHVRSFATIDPALLAQIASPVRHAGFVGLTLLFYVQTMAWPFTGLGPLHPFDVAAMATSQLLAGWLMVIASVAFAGWVLWRPTATRLLALASLLTLLPVANIVPLNIVGSIGHERFLVLPLALAVLAVVALPVEMWKLSNVMNGRLPLIAKAAMALWCVVAALNIHVTLPLWSSDLVLWKWAYSRNPESMFAQFSLASAALREQQFELAKSVIDDARKRGPIPLRLSIPYGQYLIRTQQTEAGIAEIQRALENEPQPHLRVLKAGVPLEDASFKKGDFGGWLQVYAFSTLAEAHLSLRRFEQARQDAEVAVFYQRDNPTALLLKSLASYGLDQWPTAQAEFDKARRSYAAGERQGILVYRSMFLKQLCGAAPSPHDVCRRFAAEPPIASPRKP